MDCFEVLFETLPGKPIKRILTRELNDDTPLKALKSKIVYLHERNHKANPEAYNIGIKFQNTAGIWTSLETDRDLELVLQEFSDHLYIQMSARVVSKKHRNDRISKLEPVALATTIYIDSDSDSAASLWPSKHKHEYLTKPKPSERNGRGTPMCIDLESDESVTQPKQEPSTLKSDFSPANVVSESTKAKAPPNKVQHVVKHKAAKGGGNHSGAAPANSSTERRLLSALVALRDLGIQDTTRTQLAYFSKYSVGSPGFNKTLSQQRKKKHIEYSGSTSTVSITPAGIQASPVHVSPPKSNAEVQTRWKTRLTPKAGEIIDAMVHGRSMPRQELGYQVGYADAESPGCKKQLAFLKSLGILDYVEPGREVILTNMMYPFGRP